MCNAIIRSSLIVFFNYLNFGDLLSQVLPPRTSRLIPSIEKRLESLIQWSKILIGDVKLNFLSVFGLGSNHKLTIGENIPFENLTNLLSNIFLFPYSECV